MSILGDIGKVASFGLIDLDEDADRAADEARRQSGEMAKAGEAGAAATLEVARRAEDLNRERYGEAQRLLMPRVGQSDIAQRQLMAEMGLTDYYGDQNRGHRQQAQTAMDAPRTAELQGIVDAGYGDRPEGDISGWEGERDAWFGAKRELYDMRLESEAAGPGGNIPGGNVSYDNAPGGEGYAPNRAYMNAAGYPSDELPEYLQGGVTDIPGYQQSMDEAVRAAEQSSISSGGTAYGGRRLRAAGDVGADVQRSYYMDRMNRLQTHDTNKQQMEQSYYNNYMNILQNMSQPQVAQNLASMGVGQGATIGSQNIAAQNAATNTSMGALAGSQDLMRQAVNIPMQQQADQMGMIANVGSAFI